MVDLEEKVALMRRLGVVQWDGVVLGPEPRKPVEDKDLPRRNPRDEQRELLENMLHSSGAPIEPFIGGDE